MSYQTGRKKKKRGLRLSKQQLPQYHRENAHTHTLLPFLSPCRVNLPSLRTSAFSFSKKKKSCIHTRSQTKTKTTTTKKKAVSEIPSVNKNKLNNNNNNNKKKTDLLQGHYVGASRKTRKQTNKTTTTTKKKTSGAEFLSPSKGKQEK